MPDLCFLDGPGVPLPGGMIWRRGRLTVHYNTTACVSRMPMLQPLPQTDPLTGLLTRNGMVSAISFAVEKAADRPNTGYVALNMDHLAHLNQTFGMEFGDRVLRATGAFLARRVPDLIAAGRMTGDGFSILLRCSSQESLRFRAEKLVRCLCTDLLQLDRHALVNMSAGAALLGQASRPANAIISEA